MSHDVVSIDCRTNVILRNFDFCINSGRLSFFSSQFSADVPRDTVMGLTPIKLLVEDPAVHDGGRDAFFAGSKNQNKVQSSIAKKKGFTVQHSQPIGIM